MWNGRKPLPLGRASYCQQRMQKSAPCSPAKPLVKKIPALADSFHVMHKLPVGDTPYVKAKHAQLVDRDPDKAIALFWAAINAGDRVDSALKDMSILMKQQNRADEAIEAIKSLRDRCSDDSQESLDNVLLDLYKRCGRLDEQIALLRHKLHLINRGFVFNGKRTKTARSLGKKFQVSIEQEITRLLGNLGWAYMQKDNFVAAEAVYRKALSFVPDNNKVCNLGVCLIKQGRLREARSLLENMTNTASDDSLRSESHLRSYERAQEMLRDLDDRTGCSNREISSANGSLYENGDAQQLPACQPSRQSDQDTVWHGFFETDMPCGETRCTENQTQPESLSPTAHQDCQIFTNWEDIDVLQEFTSEKGSCLSSSIPSQSTDHLNLEKAAGVMNMRGMLPFTFDPSDEHNNSSSCKVGQKVVSNVHADMEVKEVTEVLSSTEATTTNLLTCTEPNIGNVPAFSWGCLSLGFSDSKLHLSSPHNMLAANALSEELSENSSKAVLLVIKNSGTASTAKQLEDNNPLFTLKENSEPWLPSVDLTQTVVDFESTAFSSSLGNMVAEMASPSSSPGGLLLGGDEALYPKNQLKQRRLRVFKEITLHAGTLLA
eukprot:c25745_g1_i1 orf=364-2175(-)